jgi:hypothetical protein
MKNLDNLAIDLKAILVRPLEAENEKRQAREFLDAHQWNLDAHRAGQGGGR